MTKELGWVSHRGFLQRLLSTMSKFAHPKTWYSAPVYDSDGVGPRLFHFAFHTICYSDEIFICSVRERDEISNKISTYQRGTINPSKVCDSLVAT